MTDRMSRREQAGSTGILGVIIGAIILIAIVFALLGGNGPRTPGGVVSSDVTTQPEAARTPAPGKNKGKAQDKEERSPDLL